MLRKIWNYIVGEVRSVESIVAGFVRTVEDLEKHAADKIEQAAHWHQAKQEAEVLRDAASAEAAKAQTVATRIKELVA